MTLIARGIGEKLKRIISLLLIAEFLILFPACQRNKITQLQPTTTEIQEIAQSSSKDCMSRYSKTKLFFYSATAIVGCYLIYRGFKWYDRKHKASTLPDTMPFFPPPPENNIPEPNQHYVPPKAITHDDIQREFERAFPDQVGQEIKNELTFSSQEQEFIYHTGYGWMINDGRKPTKPEPELGCHKNYRNSQTSIRREEFRGEPRRRVYSNESSDEDIPEDEIEIVTPIEMSTCPDVPYNTSAFPVQRRHNNFLTHKFVEESVHEEGVVQPEPGDVLQIAERAPRSAGNYIFGGRGLWWRIRSTDT